MKLVSILDFVDLCKLKDERAQHNTAILQRDWSKVLTDVFHDF